MELQRTHEGPVRIAGRRAGGEVLDDRDRLDDRFDRDDADELEVIAELTDLDVGPPPSAADRPDGGEVFAAFYRSDYANVARALSYTLGDVDLGREATDEAMARAYARWSKIREYDSPAGWVYRVGLNWAYLVAAAPDACAAVRRTSAARPNRRSPILRSPTRCGAST